MAEKKRKVFTVEEKAHIVWRLENGDTNVNIAKEFHVSHSTISTIWKNRAKVKDLFEKNSLKLKRSRPCQHNVIDLALLNWFKQQRTNNIPISGPILLEKANELATLSGEEQFEINSSWIQRFRARHNIVFGKISGEANDAPKEVSEEWLKHTWPALSENYQASDIFNADETGLFYNMTPDKTMKFKGEKCTGGKMSKTRLTIMVAANMTGTCKKKLMVIGKSKKPRCFKNVHNLPVAYESNKKAWMTSAIFEKWLRDWDAQLKLKQRKILLLIDNCPAHPNVPNLQCIKLVFLPPNVTSILQPMDQGIIKALKMQYRKMQVLEMLRSIEEKKERKALSILDSILMISEAWDKVSAATITNCFRHAGFKKPSSLENTTDSSDEEDNIPLLILAKNLKGKKLELAQLTEALLNETISENDLEEFICLDNNLAICASTTNEDLLEEAECELNAKEGDIQEKVVEDENDEFEVPSLNEALGALRTLKKFVMCNEDLGIDQTQAILKKMQDKLEKEYEVKCKKQKKNNRLFQNV